MQKKDCFYLGKIVRKHSFKGEVVLKLDTDEPELYRNLDAVFLDIGHNLLPFFIEESLLQKGNQLRVKFEGVDSEADADSLLKTDAYLPLEFLPKLTDDKFYYHEVIGYLLEDVNYGAIGTISHINDHSAQHLFVVKHNGKEILVPIIDNFIKKVDRKNEKIIVETPEGLLDLNKDEPTV